MCKCLQTFWALLQFYKASGLKLKFRKNVTVAKLQQVLQLSGLPDTKSGNPVTGQRVFIANPAYRIPNPADRIGKIQNFALTVRKIQLIGFQKRQTRFPRNVSNGQFSSSNYKNSNPTHFEALQQERTKSTCDILDLQLVKHKNH